MYAAHVYAVCTAENILEGTGKLLDEKGALSGNITREELGVTMQQVVQQKIKSYERTHDPGRRP